MKCNKTIVKMLLTAVLMMMFSYTTFADTTAEPIVEEVNIEVDETDEVVVESITSIITINLGYEVLLTVDELGVITGFEIVKEDPVTEDPTNEDPATEDPATDDPATEDPATEDPATDDPATEDPATDDPATEDPATEDPATEDPATDDPATDDPATDDTLGLIGLTLTDGIKAILEDIDSEGEFELEVEVYADDEETSNALTESIIEVFGEVLKEEPEEIEEDMNLNAERFAKAESLGITNGKMHLLEKLKASYIDDSTFDYPTWADKPVKEIMKEIKSNKKEFHKDKYENESDVPDEPDELDESYVLDKSVESDKTKEKKSEKKKVEKSERKKVKKSNNQKNKKK